MHVFKFHHKKVYIPVHKDKLLHKNSRYVEVLKDHNGLVDGYGQGHKVCASYTCKAPHKGMVGTCKGLGVGTNIKSSYYNIVFDIFFDLCNSYKHCNQRNNNKTKG